MARRQYSDRDRHARPDGLTGMAGRRQAGSLPIFFGEISQMGGSRFHSAGPRDVCDGRWSDGRMVDGHADGRDWRRDRAPRTQRRCWMVDGR